MISKENKNLQITLNKESFKKVEEINKFLNKTLNLNLTKSQTIAYLINNFKMSNNEQTEQQQTVKHISIFSKEFEELENNNFNKWKNAILKLKNCLNCSYSQLSKILNIPESTLKKYASNKQNPSAEKQQIILKELEKNNLKLDN